MSNLKLPFGRENERYIQRTFKLLIDRNIKKDLKELTSMGNSTMTKWANDENVTREVMAKIRIALDCKMDDIAEIIPDNKED